MKIKNEIYISKFSIIGIFVESIKYKKDINYEIKILVYKL